MPTKLIKLADGTLIEAEASPGEVTQISGGGARRVESSLDRIQPILVKVCQPIAAIWDTVTDLQVDQVNVELGLSFEGEGNLFVSKAKAGANLVVTLTLSRPPTKPALAGPAPGAAG